MSAPDRPTTREVDAAMARSERAARDRNWWQRVTKSEVIQDAVTVSAEVRALRADLERLRETDHWARLIENIAAGRSPLDTEMLETIRANAAVGLDVPPPRVLQLVAEVRALRADLDEANEAAQYASGRLDDAEAELPVARTPQPAEPCTHDPKWNHTRDGRCAAPGCAPLPAVPEGEDATVDEMEGHFIDANERMGEALVAIGMALGLPRPRVGVTWGAPEILARIAETTPNGEDARPHLVDAAAPAMLTLLRRISSRQIGADEALDVLLSWPNRKVNDGS